MTTFDNFDETRVVEWIEAERKQTVTGLSVLPGATSSTIVEAALRSGERVVARLHTNDAFYREVPDRLIHEFAALEAVADLDLPTPKPLAYDEHACGVPAILMTHLVGDVDISVSRSAIRALATALHGIHGVQTAEFPWQFASFTTSNHIRIPTWTSDIALWEAALEVHASGPPDEEVVFLHRDFHPTNVLWRGGAISGVVDWIYACLGSAGADLAHCRLNLALMAGVPAAMAFAELYGVEPHPYWDVDEIFGTLPDPTFYPPWQTFGMTPIDVATLRRRIEEFLGTVVFV